MGGFLTVDACPFIPQDKANLSHGPTKLDRQPTICHGLEGESLLGHRVAQIKFDPFLDLLRFSM